MIDDVMSKIEKGMLTRFTHVEQISDEYLTKQIYV